MQCRHFATNLEEIGARLLTHLAGTDTIGTFFLRLGLFSLEHGFFFKKKYILIFLKKKHTHRTFSGQAKSGTTSWHGRTDLQAIIQTT
jgi:hypothetical protein